MPEVSSDPTVSIGLAVYNGENYLEVAVDSILAQTFGDFELIISDNASTDRTAAICERYVAQDPRVRYHRNGVNIGAARNLMLTTTMARGRYFHFAAHDDFLAPEFLEECMRVLDDRQDVVLSYTGVIEVDHHGDKLGGYTPHQGTSNRPSKRFAELARRDHDALALFGLIRMETIHAAPTMGNFTESDKVYLCALAMQGAFYGVPKPLFFKRFHAKNENLDRRVRMSFFNPDAKGKLAFPMWLEMAALFNIAATAQLSLPNRVRTLGAAAAWSVRYWGQLGRDVQVAARAIWFRARRRSVEAVYNWE